MTNPRKFRLARHWSNRELKKIAHLIGGDVVNVSAGDDIDKEGSEYVHYFTNATSYSLTNYKVGSFRGFRGRENEYLLDLTGDLPDDFVGRFDVAFNHTTLEHVFDVTTAFDNLCRLSRDLVIVVVPFCQEQHESADYGDFWRFTPTCLRQLFLRNGLEVIYEAANNEFNVATYLFFVGSKNPARWEGRMPASQQIYPAASWVGDSPWKEWASRCRAKISALSRLRRSQTGEADRRKTRPAA